MKKHEIKVEFYTQDSKNTTELFGEGVEVYPTAIQFLENVMHEFDREHKNETPSTFMRCSVTIDGSKYPMLDGYAALQLKYARLMNYIEKKKEQCADTKPKEQLFERKFKLSEDTELLIQGKVLDGAIYDVKKSIIYTDGDKSVAFPATWVMPEVLEGLATAIREHYTNISRESILAMKRSTKS